MNYHTDSINFNQTNVVRSILKLSGLSTAKCRREQLVSFGNACDPACPWTSRWRCLLSSTAYRKIPGRCLQGLAICNEVYLYTALSHHRLDSPQIHQMILRKGTVDHPHEARTQHFLEYKCLYTCMMPGNYIIHDELLSSCRYIQ